MYPFKNNFHLSILSHQRIYLSNYASPAPPRGTELFLGNLPGDVYEDEILDLFGRIGPIYQIRIMLDAANKPRGFGFVSYYTTHHAYQAIVTFRKFLIRPRVSLTVSLSEDNRRLFFRRVPNYKSTAEIEEDLKSVVAGVIEVIIHEDHEDETYNKGFALVEFENHTLAARALKKITTKQCLWGKREVTVEWARPEPIMHPVLQNKIKVLHFNSIPTRCASWVFRNFLENIFDLNWTDRIYKKKNFAFVHFKSTILADIAFCRLRSEKLMINNRQIRVEWARPEKCSDEMLLVKTFLTSTRRTVEEQTSDKMRGKHAICG